jgi:replicative DNA helicase
MSDVAPVDEFGPETREEQFDLDAERQTVGSMLLSASAVWDVIDVLQPADFYQPKHELIVRAAAALAMRSEPTDVIAVGDELERTGNLQRAGGPAYLHELTGSVLTAANAGYYAEIVKHKAIRRRLVAAGTRIVQMGQDPVGDTAQLVDLAQSELELVGQAARVEVRPVGDTLDALIDSLGVDPTYLPTPYTALDDLIGGFEPGGLYIVGARPGSGKTIVGLQAAARLAREGVVAFVSLEMGEAQLQMRLLAQYGDVNMRALRSHKLSDEDWANIAIARKRFQEAPIFIDDHSNTLEQIRSYVRSVARKGTLTGVVIDYLQLIEGSGGRDSTRQEQVAAVSRALKKLAKSLNVPVIALSQLTRDPEKRATRTPVLSDLRESGAIEQDADVVMMLDYTADTNEFWVHVVKNRHGQQGKFRLIWEGHYARLKNYEWSPWDTAGGIN